MMFSALIASSRNSKVANALARRCLALSHAPNRVVSGNDVTSFAKEILKPQQRIVTAMAASEPRLFFDNLHQWLKDDPSLKGLTVYCANPNQSYPALVDASLEDSVHYITMFLTSAVRAHQSRMVSYLPHHLSAWAKAIQARGPIDIFWGTCTPPQANGYVSLGPSCVYEAESLRKAKMVVLEINPSLPYVHGSPVIPINRADAVIEGDAHDPLMLPQASYDDIDMTIAQSVAKLVPDEATVQFGIGSIPNALCDALEHHRDLGVHTEMINDCIMKLVEKGVVTGKAKTQRPERVVGSFALGSKGLYDYMHDNPEVTLLPGALVNGLEMFSRNHKMHSINTCVELDFTGQICSESVGHRELSGVGGAADTHIAAQRSEGGRGIIAVRSTAKNGASKIVSALKPGAKVSISRNDIDTVVTEYGVADLKGMSVSERVQALIQLAHPDHREQLTNDAIEHRYL
eukprot:TRINITY_DN11776_c0_g4_i1.p1 TRINITY_DN11776_c0_g4~~TRINITY_DN11776_c0_g4_i1.p1  ORF type:complete len:460 (+),score=99.15 TRINITY_DN11776_c0_g4_i1:114-1493(+)